VIGIRQLAVGYAMFVPELSSPRRFSASTIVYVAGIESIPATETSNRYTDGGAVCGCEAGPASAGEQRSATAMSERIMR
jgi:hypothetical protein